MEKKVTQKQETEEGKSTKQKNSDEVTTYNHGGAYGKLEQVIKVKIQLNNFHITSFLKDWKESHAAYKILEAKRLNQSKVLLKSISKSQFGISK